MAIWTDIAIYRGPTVNQGGRMVEQRGVVIHIAEGTYEGTISWQKNPAAQVSSHFVVALDGTIAQVVDTDTAAWTQSAGNGHWLSVENAGFHTGQLTAAQVEANARLLAKAHLIYGVPLQLADDPSGKGLGHHGMGGAAWGGHYDCPGTANVALKPTILARAQQLVGAPAAGGDDMGFIARDETHRLIVINADWTGFFRMPKDYPGGEGQFLSDRAYWGATDRKVVDQGTGDFKAFSTSTGICGVDLAATGGGGGTVTGPVDLTPAAIEKIADAVVDEEHNRLAG